MSAKVEKATDFCAYCPKMCRFACPVADAEARETVTPWGLMSLLRAVRMGHVELTAEIGEAFYHCTGCLRCQTFCRHDNDVPEAMFDARRLLVEGGVPVPEAVRGLDLIQERHGSPLGAVPALPEEIEAIFDRRSRVGFRPGCHARQAPQRLGRLGQLLEAALEQKVALVTVQTERATPSHCCGESLREAGYGAVADAVGERSWATFEHYDRVVTDCAGMIGAWERRFPGAGGGPEHLVGVLARSGGWRLRAEAPDFMKGRRVFYHDGRFGRRLGLYDEPRAVLEGALGRAAEELWSSREASLGLGAGAHYGAIDAEGARVATAAFAAQASAEGAEVIVTADVEGAEHLRAVTDLEVVELLDLVAMSLGLEIGAQPRR